MSELETNPYIIQNFGNLKSDKWTESMFITSTGVQVEAKGTGSKMRGSRNLQHRPDLLICDDLENLEMVRTKEQRDKNENWLLKEAIPALNQEIGRTIVIGNMLHFDSLMSRLKAKKEWNTVEIPIIIDGEPAWKERHTLEHIQRIKERVGSIAYAQEYMLTPILETDQIIKKSWIQYYSNIQPKFIKRVLIALDPAISEKQSADKSAFTVWAEYTDGNIYLLDYVNENLSFDAQVKQTRNLYNAYQEYEPIIIIEDVAYQKALIQHLVHTHHLPVKSVKPIGDKRSRLMEISAYFENGMVFFKPTHDDVVLQLINFGSERYDDLVDSCVHAVKFLLGVSRAKGYTKTNLKL